MKSALAAGCLTYYNADCKTAVCLFSEQIDEHTQYDTYDEHGSHGDKYFPVPGFYADITWQLSKPVKQPGCKMHGCSDNKQYHPCQHDPSCNLFHSDIEKKSPGSGDSYQKPICCSNISS